MMDVQPGALTLPNAPKVHGFALVKPADPIKAEANIKNPKWQVPEVLQTWLRNGKLCAEDLVGFKYHR